MLSDSLSIPLNDTLVITGLLYDKIKHVKESLIDYHVTYTSNSNVGWLILPNIYSIKSTKVLLP